MTFSGKLWIDKWKRNNAIEGSENSDNMQANQLHILRSSREQVILIDQSEIQIGTRNQQMEMPGMELIAQMHPKKEK